MRRAWWLLAIVGCSPKVDDLVLPLSRPGTLLVISQVEAQTPEILVIEVPDPPPAYLALTVPDEATQLWAIFNDCGADSLGLLPGTYHPSSDPHDLPLPVPALLLERHYSADDAGTWQEADELPIEIAELRLPTQGTRCLELSATIRNLPNGSAGFRVMAPLPDRDGVFVATEAGEFYLIYRDRTLLVETSTAIPHAGGYQEPTGRVWLVGADGTIGRWVDDGFPIRRIVVAPILPGFFKGSTWVDGAPDGSEIFAMDQWGGMARFETGLGTWTVLNPTCTRAPRNCDTISHGAVEWIRPGEALFVGDVPGISRRYRNGAKVDEPFQLNQDSLVQALLPDPDYGLVAGTRRGQVIALQSELWSPHLMAPDMTRIDVLVRFRRGLLFGGDRGLLGQYHPGVGVCDFDLVTAGDIKLITTTDVGLVVAARVIGSSNVPDDDESHVDFLDPLAPPVPECARRPGEVAGW